MDYKKDVEEKDFYVCPHHREMGGWESCCACSGWREDEPHRLCTEAIENGEEQK